MTGPPGWFASGAAAEPPCPLAPQATRSPSRRSRRLSFGMLWRWCSTVHTTRRSFTATKASTGPAAWSGACVGPSAGLSSPSSRSTAGSRVTRRGWSISSSSSDSCLPRQPLVPTPLRQEVQWRRQGTAPSRFQGRMPRFAPSQGREIWSQPGCRCGAKLESWVRQRGEGQRGRRASGPRCSACPASQKHRSGLCAGAKGRPR